MPSYPGWIGESYPSESPQDRAVCENWYLEKNESETARTPWSLRPTPGLRRVLLLPQAPIRSLFENNGRAFAVTGFGYHELFHDAESGVWSSTQRGTLVADANPATQSANGTAGGEIFITSGGVGSIFTLATNTLTTVLPSGATMGAYLDNRFLSLDAATGTVKFSGILQGTVWHGADAFQRAKFGDPWVTMAVTPEGLIRLLGTRTGEAWVDTGAAFPFALIQESVIPYGITNSFAFTVDTSLTWVAQNAEGRGQIVRAQSYAPVRVSNHGIEYAIQHAARLDDVVAFSYQEQGHPFAVFTLPTDQTTWVVDGATSKWHARTSWSTRTGTATAYRPGCAISAFGTTLVGDRETGAIYEMRNDLYTDVDGAAIRRVRQPPPIGFDRQRAVLTDFEVLCDVGVGLNTGQGRDPQAMLQISRDGGLTFGPEHWTTIGPIGRFDTRARFRNLGSARSFTPRLVISDPVPARLGDALVHVRGQAA